MSMQKGGVGVLFQLLQCLNRPRQTTLKQLCQTFPWSLSVYSLKLRQSGEIMLWFDCWTTGSRHCSNSFTSSHNIQTSSFAINQFSLIHSFHFTKKGVTYTCFLARWVDKEIEMPAACFTAQLGGEAFLQRDLAPICSGQWGRAPSRPAQRKICKYIVFLEKYIYKVSPTVSNF